MNELKELMKALHIPEQKFTVEEVEEIIKDYDFVPVVRCKDCKYCKMEKYIGGEGMACQIMPCDGNVNLTEPNDFCSNGERRDEDETN